MELLSQRDNADRSVGPKLDSPFPKRKEGVIASPSHKVTGFKFGPSLTHDNAPRPNLFAAERFHAEALGL